MPKQVDHDARRDAIAAAAIKVISKQGISEATIKRIAAEIGGSHGSLGHYVKSKDELLVLAAEYRARQAGETLKRILDEEKGLEAIRKVILHGINADGRDLEMWDVWLGFMERARSDKGMRGMLRSYYKSYRTMFRKLIRQAQKMGEVAADIDPDVAASSAIMLIDGLCVQAFAGGLVTTPAAKRKHIDIWIEAMLRPRKARKS